MSFPLKNDAEKANQFFLGYLQAITENPETAQGWKDLNMVVGVKLLDLDLGYTIDSSSQEILIAAGFPENPDAGISFTSDTFHELFLGNSNPVMALAMGKIKTSGSNKKVLGVAGILPQNFKAYRDYLESQGLS